MNPLLDEIAGAEHQKIGGVLRGAYADGCTFDYAAPCVVAIEGGHDAWVEGGEAAVLVQFDAEQQTARLFGLPERHAHG